jgi:hypothetical protein
LAEQGQVKAKVGRIEVPAELLLATDSGSRLQLRDVGTPASLDAQNEV